MRQGQKGNLQVIFLKLQALYQKMESAKAHIYISLYGVFQRRLAVGNYRSRVANIALRNYTFSMAASVERFFEGAPPLVCLENAFLG